MNAPKIKLALCVQANHLLLPWHQVVGREAIEIYGGFWMTSSVLVDRAICETDPSYQQLLPYNVLIDEEGRIFTYARGAAGAESRLHARLSIGVGGHVDGMVPPGRTLQEWLVEEGNREIKEEVGLEPLEFEFTRLLVDKTDEVGRVHLGLLSVSLVSHKDVKGVEAEAILNGEWKYPAELVQPTVYDRLENWSKLAVDLLVQQ